MTDIIERLWQSVTEGNAPSKDLAIEAADEIERLDAVVLKQAGEIERLRKQTLLAPSISWDGFLVSGMQESINEVCRLIDLERRGHK